jgi:hypothetical protein
MTSKGHSSRGCDDCSKADNKIDFVAIKYNCQRLMALFFSFKGFTDTVFMLYRLIKQII